MTSERKRLKLSPLIEGVPLSSLTGAVAHEEGDASSLARLGRTALEVAAASGAAAVFFDRGGALGEAVKTARELGFEPRILALGGRVGIPARLSLGFLIQQERGTAPFQAAADLIAGFVVRQAGRSGADGGPLRTKVRGAIAAARAKSTLNLEFAQIRAHVASALPPTHPDRKASLAAIEALELAEEAAASCGPPVLWSTLLADSPAGRRAAVLAPLGKRDGSAGDLVEGLGLLALAAEWPQVVAARAGGPVMVLAGPCESPLASFAAEQLAQTCASPAGSLALLLHKRGASASAVPGLAEGRLLEDALEYAKTGTRVPLVSTWLRPAPLSDAEVLELTPATLTARLLGEVPEEGAEEDTPTVLSPAASDETVRAIKTATSDLDSMARAPPKSRPLEKEKKKASYDLGDFDVD